MRDYQHRVFNSLAFTLVASLAYSSPAESATNAELQNKVKDLKTTVEKLKTNIDKLETRVVKSDKRTSRRLRSLRETIKHKHTGLKIGGYGSYGLSTANADYDDATVTFRDEFIYRTDTMGALQVDYVINDQISTTIQMVSEAIGNFDLNVDWAYVTYQFDDNWKMQMGRIPHPLGLYSQQLKTGISYPWVRPPMGFYITSVSGAEEILIDYQNQIGSWYHQLTWLAGASEIFPFPNVKVAVEDAYSMAYQVDHHAWTLRFFHSISDVRVDGSDLNDYADASTISLRYDDGNWFFLGEGFILRGGNLLIGDIDRQMLSLGKYFGSRYMGYLTATNSQAYDDPEVNNADSRTKSHAVGLRYNIHPQVALKGEWEHFYDQKVLAFPSNSFSMVIDVAF